MNMYDPEQSHTAQVGIPALLALILGKSLNHSDPQYCFLFKKKKKGGDNNRLHIDLKESNEVTHVKVLSIVPGTYKSSINSSYCYY